MLKHQIHMFMYVSIQACGYVILVEPLHHSTFLVPSEGENVTFVHDYFMTGKNRY